ncbi:MAG: glycosyltransferase [bacterium]
MKELSVVICTCNRSDLLSRALESIAGQTLDGNRFEVAVIDNNSTDDTKVVTESFMDRIDLKYFFEAEQGYAPARNRGWRETNGRYVAYMDDDARAAPDWCEKILYAFESVTPKPAIVGGLILPDYQSTPPGWFSDSLETRSWGDQAHFLEPPTAKDGFSSSNMAVSREIFHLYGGFTSVRRKDGREIHVGEDTRFCRKVFEYAPFFWYDPGIVVYHLVPEWKMKIAYRFVRSYRSGKAYSYMQEDVGEIYGAFRKFASVVYFVLITAPTRVIGNTGEFRSETVRVLQELAWRLGGLFS